MKKRILRIDNLQNFWRIVRPAQQYRWITHKNLIRHRGEDIPMAFCFVSGSFYCRCRVTSSRIEWTTIAHLTTWKIVNRRWKRRRPLISFAVAFTFLAISVLLRPLLRFLVHSFAYIGSSSLLPSYFIYGGTSFITVALKLESAIWNCHQHHKKEMAVLNHPIPLY